MKLAVIALALLALISTTWAQTSGADKTAAFDKLADQYFHDVYYRFIPTQVTAAGFHEVDGQLENYSRASINQQISVLNAQKRLFEAVNPAQLSQRAAADRELVLGDINSKLLTLENIRPWEKNPDFYSSNVTGSIFVIMARTFAPAPERLKSAIAREKQIPAVFDAARQNLKNPPPIYVDVALEQLPGIVSFFQKDVPEAFKSVTDPALLQQFHSSNQAVIASLQ
ncbi:MAG TPA: DUF885 family protein, partial [Terriglobales bacterium]|nr:DUF885 family protein [Terriglobales bacterium]